LALGAKKPPFFEVKQGCQTKFYFVKIMRDMSKAPIFVADYQPLFSPLS
jgi:hypothetical protein